MKIALPCLALLCLFAAGSAPLGVDPSDEDAVRDANNAFFVALNAMLQGDPQPIEKVWWHTDDVVYMGADGAYNAGWDQTYANWKAQAAIHIGGKATVSDVRLSITGDMAMTNQIVTATATDTVPAAKMRSTSVFRKKDGQWRMICHHVDPISALRGKTPGDLPPK